MDDFLEVAQRAEPVSGIYRIDGRERASLRATPVRGNITPGRMDADQELVARVQAGDARAFTELFRLHRSRVARLVQRFVAVREVEDVVQEVFLHVHRSLASFRGESKFSTWLYRLALNIARMHVRKQASRPKFSGEEPAEIEDTQSTDRDPEALAMRSRRLQALQAALSQIAEKKREVFVLHDLDGMPAREIAELVDAPVLTVRTRLFYARKELLTKMRDYPELSDLAKIFSDGGSQEDKAEAPSKASKNEPTPTASALSASGRFSTRT